MSKSIHLRVPCEKAGKSVKKRAFSGEIDPILPDFGRFWTSRDALVAPNRLIPLLHQYHHLLREAHRYLWEEDLLLRMCPNRAISGTPERRIPGYSGDPQAVNTTSRPWICGSGPGSLDLGSGTLDPRVLAP